MSRCVLKSLGLKLLIPNIFMFIILLNNVHAQSAKDMVKNLAESKDYVQAAAFIHQAIAENRKDFDLMILSGDIYFELENTDSALIMFMNADKINRNEPKVLRKIAKALSRLNKPREAINKAFEAIEEDDKDVYNFLCLGNVYLEADSLKKAELYITKAREINKNIPDAFIALGDLYYAQYVYELAKNNYEEALSIDEENVEARTKLALSYYWLANREYDEDLANELFKKSLQEWNTITKKDPKNAKAFFEQGKILFFSHRFDKAAQSLYEYVRLRPSSSLGRWYLAQSLYELALCDSAAPHLRICAEQIDSVKNKAKLLLARCYFDAKDYERSMATYDYLVGEIALDNMDLERFGAASFQIGDTLKAIELYLRVIENDSSRCKLIFKTGVMLYILGKFDESVELMSKRLDKCNDEFTPKTFFYLGSAFLKMDSLHHARDYFALAFESDTTDFLSLLYLSDAFAKSEQDDSAAFFLELVIERTISDTSNFAWLTNNAFAKLCNLYYKTKDYKKLKMQSEAWLKLKKENSIAYLYIATYYQSIKDIDNACRNYKHVIKFDESGNLKPIAQDQISRLNCL